MYCCPSCRKRVRQLYSAAGRVVHHIARHRQTESKRHIILVDVSSDHLISPGICRSAILCIAGVNRRRGLNKTIVLQKKNKVLTKVLRHQSHGHLRGIKCSINLKKMVKSFNWQSYRLEYYKYFTKSRLRSFILPISRPIFRVFMPA